MSNLNWICFSRKWTRTTVDSRF